MFKSFFLSRLMALSCGSGKGPAKNPKARPLRKTSSGSALIIAILLIMAMTVIGLSLMFISDVERDIAYNDEKSKDAYDAAITALEHARYILAHVNVNDGDHWDDDLKGKPTTAAALNIAYPTDPTAGPFWYKDGVSVPGSPDPANINEASSEVCRTCKSKGAIVFDDNYRDIDGTSNPRFLFQVPFYATDSKLGAERVVKGYYSVWIRNNMGEIEPSPNLFSDTDDTIFVMVEVLVRRFPDVIGDEDPTPHIPEANNPIVARLVMGEVIELGDIDWTSEDIHNTNTYYNF